MTKLDPSEKLHAMSKSKLKAEAERCGVHIRQFWSKDRIVKEILKSQPIARKTALLSVEALAEADLPAPSLVQKEPDQNKHVKFVDVKWLGVSKTHHHAPHQGVQLRFERGQWINIRAAIWAAIPKSDNNAQKRADDMFDEYAKYYIEESNRPQAFWATRTRVGPIPIDVTNKKANDWVKTARDFLDDSGEEVLLKLKGIMDTDKEDLYFGNDHAHVLAMLYQLEVEGKHRRTILDRIQDNIDVSNKRDKRNMKTEL